MSHYAKGGTTLSPQTSGLRFDIYERVHLPDDTAGIRELHGVELAPDISVAEQGEQAILKGHLVLTAVYAGEDETRGDEQLTHRIPVEITLPLSRIENVEALRMEIETFDVDVLSARSLNVTGVLSLEGVAMQAASEPDWREEEEVVFAHRVEPQQPAPAAAPSEPETTPAFEAAPSPAPADAIAPTADAVVAASEHPGANAAAEPQEMKIAFAGKPPAAADQAPIGVDAILSMAGHPPAEKRDELAAAEPPPQAPQAPVASAAPAASASFAAPEDVAPAAPAAQPAPAISLTAAARPQPVPAAAHDSAEGKDRLEWKKLFLQTGSDETPFRKVRLCIAQKEDTIETIADRYKKSPRELMLYNRINDQYLQEGQIVYIP